MLDFSNLPRFKKDSFRILELIPEWARAYDVPEEAIIRQLAWAHGWTESNKRHAPKKDVIRFLWNWMRKAKEYGNLTVDPPHFPNAKIKDPEPTMTVEEMRNIRQRNYGPL